ncbi:helix-turn-helix domain-containing protein [Nocardioides sp. CPCC 205120]|uniref:helix-turn-helix domain-containing protein n=1 Tax=Nocardioides sp. CPCC 205120 TaxID=3406462 RepID=UPI003B509C73
MSLTQTAESLQETADELRSMLTQLAAARWSQTQQGAEPPRMLYGYAEAADALSVSAKQIERLAAAGYLETVPLGRRRLIPHSSLDELVKRLLAGEPIAL